MIDPGDVLAISVALWIGGRCVSAVVFGVTLAVARYRWRRESRARAWTPLEAAAHWQVRRVLTHLRHGE